MSSDEVVRGFAPGVDARTNTFTCPKCRVSRDCQALNPVCLSCGYQDPRSFDLPDRDYLVADSPRGPWRPWRPNDRQHQRPVVTPAVLVGQAIGDALGMPFEKLGDEVHPDLATWDGSYKPGTWHDLPAGHWTDDTEMAVCLATSLIECHGFDGADVARRYLAWSQATPHGMGGTTREAMALLARGVSWTCSGIEFQNPYQVGGGPPMRAAPIGAYNFAPSLIYDICRQDAYITHASHEAAAASFAVALATRLALNRCEPTALLEEVTRWILGAEKERGLAKTQVREDLQLACIAQSKETPIEEIVPRLFSRRGNARAITATAIYCAALAESFRDGVIAAIRLGGDADTRGAIAGAILGARFGLEGIPDEYKRGLLKFEELRQLDQCLAPSQISP